MRITFNNNNYIQLRRINQRYFDFEILFSNDTDFNYFWLQLSFSFIQHIQLDLSILHYFNFTIYIGTQSFHDAI